MEQIIAAIFALFTSLADVPSAQALMSTAKDSRLTIETAVQHIAAARFAGTLTDVDPDLILAIAYHESRFTPGVEGPLLYNGKRACGVMQHVPVKGPCPKRSLLADYLAGAKHLAGWIRAERGDLKLALAGYAGGYAGIARYEEGATRARAVVQLNLARAARIKRARELAAPRPEKRKHEVSPS
jgi:soluble lytic murein transglycosylase-like protein